MYCEQCGTKLEEGKRFCTGCGAYARQVPMTARSVSVAQVQREKVDWMPLLVSLGLAFVTLAISLFSTFIPIYRSHLGLTLAFVSWSFVSVLPLILRIVLLVLAVVTGKLLSTRVGLMAGVGVTALGFILNYFVPNTNLIQISQALAYLGSGMVAGALLQSTEMSWKRVLPAVGAGLGLLLIAAPLQSILMDYYGTTVWSLVVMLLIIVFGVVLIALSTQLKTEKTGWPGVQQVVVLAASLLASWLFVFGLSSILSLFR